MKKLVTIAFFAVAFVATSNAGILKFTSKHVVVPVAKTSGKVAKGAGKAAAKVATTTAKATKKVVF